MPDAAATQKQRLSTRWLLLPVETKAREFHAKLLLGARAVERGYSVVLGEQNAMVRQIAYLPRGLYVDKSIASTKTKHFRRLRQHGNKVAAWCEEGLVYRDRDAYLRQRISLDSLAEAERFFCWGDVQRDDIAAKATLASAGGGREKLVPTGNPRFDLLRPEFRDLFAPRARELRGKYGSFILINTNFARYNHFHGEDNLLAVQRQRGTVDGPDEEAFLLAWRDFLGEMYHAFAAMLAPLSEAFPEHRIILRPHPSENHERWLGECAGLDNVEVIFAGNVVPWLLAAGVLIHNSCTTGLEGFLLDRPVIAYRPVRSQVYDSFLPNVVSHQVADMPMLVEAVGDALDGAAVNGGDQGTAAASQYYAALDGAAAVDRVLDAVDGLGLPPTQPTGPGYHLGRLSGHLHIPARNLARRLLRPGAAAYGRQKFPHLDLAEMRRELAGLQTASGRFGTVTVAPLAHQCYALTAGA
jgi:surface carbohydrate biosynthesis protein